MTTPVADVPVVADLAACLEHDSPSIELVIRARPRDLGGFAVSRLLPAARRRLVGPFIFFDYFGPTTFAADSGLDVRPHPHIGLATVTYLFAGEIVHRDSLGSLQVIRPGDVNWMVAGRGIVHSERTALELRKHEHALHGVQAWVALPVADEECEPGFFHQARTQLPFAADGGVELRLIAGSGFGLLSTLGLSTPMLYADASFAAGGQLTFAPEHEERALCVVHGSVRCEGASFGPGELVVLRPGASVQLSAAEPARALLLGGAHLPGEREIFWNFVSSSPERLARAKDDWREGRFASVPGDEVEFIPLPAG